MEIATAGRGGWGRQDAPMLMACDNESVTVQWAPAPNASAYELQWRPEQHGAAWITASDKLGSTATRKKNLATGEGYFFRVRPCMEGCWEQFSSPSLSLRPGVSPAILRVVGETLVDPSGGVHKTGAILGGKLVALYFSAHWCPPCRQFTPQLAEFYQQMKAAGKPFEVIFVSSDKDGAQFREYHGSQPWHAVPFGSKEMQTAGQA